MQLIKSFTRTALITGANSGLGFEVALELARRRYKVIMADRVDQTFSQKEIMCKSNNDDIHSYHLDLGSFDCIRSFADVISKDLDCINVLVNNAGVFCMKKQKTVDSLDAVMQVNHLGPFLLTNLMIPLLKKSLDGRIIFVTSSGSFFHTLTLDKLIEPNYFTPHFISGALHYYNTKLCNMIASRYFAEKLKDDNISCNCLHPFMMKTGFLVGKKQENLLQKLEARVAKKLVNLATRDPQHCADGVVFLANSNQVRNITGKYFFNYRVHREPRIMEDSLFCNQICNETLKLIGLNE